MPKTRTPLASQQWHRAAANLAQRFRHHCGVGIIQSHATLFFRLGEPQKSERAHFFEQIMSRKIPRLPIHRRAD